MILLQAHTQNLWPEEQDSSQSPGPEVEDQVQVSFPPLGPIGYLSLPSMGLSVSICTVEVYQHPFSSASAAWTCLSLLQVCHKESEWTGGTDTAGWRGRTGPSQGPAAPTLHVSHQDEVSSPGPPGHGVRSRNHGRPQGSHSSVLPFGSLLLMTTAVPSPTHGTHCPLLHCSSLAPWPWAAGVGQAQRGAVPQEAARG